MRDAPRVAGSRVAYAAVVAAVFTFPLVRLWRFSPFDALAPATLAGLPAERALTLAVALLAFAAALQTRTSPLPWLAGLAAAALVPLLYPYTTIDWTRLLKDWGLVTPEAPPAFALALAVAPFAVAFAAHAWDHRERLSRRLDRKGVPPTERDSAGALVARRAALAVAGAVLATAALGGAFLLLRPVGDALARWPLPFAAPVAAAAVLAALAWGFLARSPRDAT